MAIKVGNLWAKPVFKGLSTEAKLLYLYIVTNPQLNMLGVLIVELPIVSLETKLPADAIRSCTKELVSNNLLHAVKFDKVYFVLEGHFNKNIRSEATLLKAQNILSSYEDGFREYLTNRGIKLDVKIEVFKKPTVKEVEDYAKTLGHIIEGKTFVNFYNNSSENRLDGKWQDGRGKLITNWKAKVRKVWCKDENKIKVVDGCPKGAEGLSIIFLDKEYFPESWKDSVPSHSDFGVSKMLRAAYKQYSQ